MRKLTTVAAGSALAVVTAAGIAASTASAATQSSHGADDRRSHSHVQVLKFIDKVGPDSNTDIDLSPGDDGIGDQQVFHDDLFRNGHRIGIVIGVAQTVARTETTLMAQVVSTATLPGGTLTTQMAFVETLADGPPSVLRSAITGGTGSYHNARGECQAHFLNNTDDAQVTCTISLQ